MFDRLDREADEMRVLDHGQQAEIGIAARPRITAAGQVHRVEPGRLDEPRGQRVIGARHHRVAALRDQLSQFLAWGHRKSSRC
jgi:hypothetical protein